MRLGKKTAIIEKNGRPYKVSNTMLKGFKHRHLEFDTLIKEINELKSLVPIQEIEESDELDLPLTTSDQTTKEGVLSPDLSCSDTLNPNKELPQTPLRRSSRSMRKTDFYGI